MDLVSLIKNKLGVSILGVVLSASAFAGVSTSGGGFAVVARDSQGKIISAELLDLYEAKNKLGFKLAKDQGEIFANIDQATENIFRLQWPASIPESVKQSCKNEQMAKRREFFKNKVSFISPPEKLTWQGDFGKTIPLLPEENLEQLAVYDDTTETLKIDSEIWQNLDTQNQAALIEHEIWYREMGGIRKPTSEWARLWVGHAFADDSVPSVSEGIPVSAEKCNFNQRATVSAFKFSKGSTDVLQFLYIGDIGFPTVAEVELPSGFQVGTSQLLAIRSTFNLNWELELNKISASSFELKMHQDGKVIYQGTLNCQ